MNVQAKFRCSSARKYADNRWEHGVMVPGFAWEYEFHAVTSGSVENAKFFAATPSGNIKLSAIREDLFQPGEEYYLDFSPAKE